MRVNRRFGLFLTYTHAPELCRAFQFLMVLRREEEKRKKKRRAICFIEKSLRCEVKWKWNYIP